MLTALLLQQQQQKSPQLLLPYIPKIITTTEVVSIKRLNPEKVMEI